MGRYRSRSRSYSPRRRTPSPPRRKKRYDDLRDRRHHRRQSSGPCGLLVRNVALDTRPEDLRIPFEKFGPVKDVYLPRNYYTGEPRGFAFVKFRFPEDAAEAKDRLSHTIVGGREIRIVYAEENRKTPQEMRKSTHISGSYEGRRQASPRSPRGRYHSYSRSPAGRRQSRSRSPRSRRYNRSTMRSLSPRDYSADERDGRTAGSFQSPKENSSRDEKRYKSSRKSHSSAEMSPHDKYKMSRRSPSLREISPHDNKDLKSSGRSLSPRNESPLAKDNKEKQRALSSRIVSSPDEDYRTNKGSISPQETPPLAESTGMSSHKILSQSVLSSDHERSHQLKLKEKSPGKNDRSPLRGRGSTSSSLMRSRMNGGSVSPSRSWSHSPHQ